MRPLYLYSLLERSEDPAKPERMEAGPFRRSRDNTRSSRPRRRSDVVNRLRILRKKKESEQAEREEARRRTNAHNANVYKLKKLRKKKAGEEAARIMAQEPDKDKRTPEQRKKLAFVTGANRFGPGHPKYGIEKKREDNPRLERLGRLSRNQIDWISRRTRRQMQDMRDNPDSPYRNPKLHPGKIARYEADNARLHNFRGMGGHRNQQ